MKATPIPVCWSRAEIQNAAQVDAGGLEFGDPEADAVFQAVHQSVPLLRRGKTGAEEPVTEDDVVADLYQPLNSNEPHIRFITGRVGNGKSHFVRWLRSKAPARTGSHFVYIEKRNTSLRRVIENILSGIDTPAADNIRTTLATAAARVTTVPEAMLAILNHLHRMVEYDDATAIQNLAGADLAEIRKRVARLVGDYTFKQQLSRPGGPIERVARLAKEGQAPGADIDPEDLRITEADLRVDVEPFLAESDDFQRQIRSLMSNRSLRAAAATVLDFYLPRATAEVFTGSSTDLLHVFEDVRTELARRRQELYLFVEDLVLLHGAEAQLAQALTVPARKNLCRIRAAIAVTSGHLTDRYATFADRGVHYTMDVPRTDVDRADLRSFVGKYLNAGRVGRRGLALAAQAGEEEPNQCTGCAYQDRCHPVFGVTREGHGLFPFNATAVDRLVDLASPEGFDPRNILREVVRAPLEVAEQELATPGRFPSARFGASLQRTRMGIPVEVRDTITRRSSTPESEISLRAFYAANPPAADDAVLPIAEVFGVQLTDLGDDRTVTSPATVVQTAAVEPSVIDAWVGGQRLGAQDARDVRKWVLDALAARLQAGPHGVTVRRSGSDVCVGAVAIKMNHIILENAAGGGSRPPESLTIEFSANDSDGVLLKGILAAVSGNLAGPNGGRWFFEMQARLAKLQHDVLERARQDEAAHVQALAVLGVLSSVDDRQANSPAEALSVMIRPRRPTGINQGVLGFLDAVDGERRWALRVLRDNLTQRKGNGAFSIFDAGPVLGYLLPSVSLTQLPESVPPGTRLGVNLSALHERQAAAARSLWAPIRPILDRIGQYVTAADDLHATAKLLDTFVEQAHRASVLGRPDAREVYLGHRGRMSDERLSELRRVTRIAASASGPAALWDLTHDPMPLLSEALEYWRLCDQLVRSLRDTVASTHDSPETYDRARLQRAFRALADNLERLPKS